MGKLFTFSDALLAELDEIVRNARGVSWPSARWRNDPEGFCREVLGIDPWTHPTEDDPLDIIRSFPEHKRIACKSGHKTAKTYTAAALALWFYCSFPDARVLMCSTTAHQINNILWRALRMVIARSGVCLECKAKNAKLKDENDHGANHELIEAPCPHSAVIDGKLAEKAQTGLKSDNFREIKGVTAKEPEGAAGISGPFMLYILDEASGIPDAIFEAIEGNRAAGAWIILFSNPTRTVGEFYEAFNTKREVFDRVFTLNSENTPNARFGEDDPRAIPGLAGKKWIEEKRKEWGEESAQYKVRVLGEFAEEESRKPFTIHLLTEAEKRFEEKWSDEDREARLHIGLDPSGSGADETLWALRRGKRVMRLLALQKTTAQSMLSQTLQLCREEGRPREVPVVTMDGEGKIGAEVSGVFRAYLQTQASPPFELVVLRASDGPHKNPAGYARLRDELAGWLSDWLDEGGALPPDAKLGQELLAMEWVEREDPRLKLVDKKVLRKLLKRSPDRYDAVALSVWETIASLENKPRRQNTYDPPKPGGSGGSEMVYAETVIDPFASW